MPTIAIAPRFNGLPDIALGGYVGGVLSRGRPTSEVQLRRPVKIGKLYETVDNLDGTRSLQEGSEVLAVIRDSVLDLELPQPIGLEETEAAAKEYVGYRKHLVPNCFNCGPLRSEGDGLRIFPGKVTGSNVVAAPWTPAKWLGDSSGRIEPEFIWSALDCPTIWALILHGQPESKDMAVTASLAVKLITPIQAGRPHIVMGWKISEIERNKVAGGAIYSAEGQLCATAKHTLVKTSWGVPMGLNSWR